jgi:hypothetical protein
MAEWLKAHAWKACLPQGNVGSNPTLSATKSSQEIQKHPRTPINKGQKLTSLSKDFLNHSR